MHRIRLIHWNENEAAARLRSLHEAGYRVDYSGLTPHVLKKIGDDPPDAVVIDLTRLPSHGRDVALALRSAGRTRRLPLVFVAGDETKVARIRQQLPDAVYATWRGIRGALTRAIARPPVDPVVPASRLAGYSGTPLPRKLGIKPGYVVALIGAPSGFREALVPLPADTVLRTAARGRCDLIVWFTTRRSELERRVSSLGQAAGAGGLWICWPKRASARSTDLSQAHVRRVGLAAGFVDYKICAVDDTWSGLRFARRKGRA